MKIKYFFPFFILLFPYLMIAQTSSTTLDNDIGFCLTDELHRQYQQSDNKYQNKHTDFEKSMYLLQQHNLTVSNEKIINEVVPVVVHIIHNEGEENIGDNQVLAAMEHLNDAFANTGFYDPETGVEVGIEFCLAVRTPDGQATTGINRVQSTFTELTAETQDIDLKSVIQWNSHDYLNIWVVKEIISASAGSGVAGYAYLPSSHGELKDGIVVEANYFGLNAHASKVLIHEAGHYLGLYHTFEGSCTNNDCLVDGDRICDTPPDQSTASIACELDINSCTTDENDSSENNPFRSMALGGIGEQDDMVINYMDYGKKECKTAFTAGQSVRMVNALTTTRQSLGASLACVPPCLLPSFSASFENSPTLLMVNESASFMNTTGAATGFEWFVDGVFLGNTTDLNYTFEEEGTYTVTLTASDSANFCLNTVSVEVDVVCLGEAEFTTNSTSVFPNETIEFTNEGSGSLSYEWYVDGTLYSTNFNESITFEMPGYYSVYLTSMSPTGNCINTSTTVNIIVGNCGNDRTRMNWRFGQYAGLDFNSGAPVPVLNSSLLSFEGSSTMSDENGDLLFYSNGITVWDRENNIMPNGSGLLGGSLTSARHMVIFVPVPENPNQYYIFCNDEFENGFNLGLNYSIIDMTLNGGLGDVTDTKNVYLSATNQETMGAVYHSNGVDAWFVLPLSFPINELHAFRIDANGIHLPVITSMAPRINPFSPIFFNGGKKVILSRATPFPVRILPTIFDFNGETGEFLNPIEIELEGTSSLTSMEVSPDGTKLYIMRVGGVLQFDLSLTTAQAIEGSKVQIVNPSGLLGQMRLAPDGKIYISSYFQEDIHVINSPNLAGLACDFQMHTVSLGGNKSEAGLPLYIRGNRYSANVVLNNPEEVCIGNTAEVSIKYPDASCNYEWYVNDVLVPMMDGDTILTLESEAPDSLMIKVIKFCDCGVASSTVALAFTQPDDFDLGGDRGICFPENILLEVEGDYVSYQWQNGSTDASLLVEGASENWVEVVDEAGCVYRDTLIIIQNDEAPTVNLGADQVRCEGMTVVFDAGTGAESYQWQDGGNGSTYTAWLPGTYWVEATNACGTSSDTVSFFIENQNLVDLGEDVALCEQGSVVLSAEGGGAYYNWQDGSEDIDFTAYAIGLYWVEVSTQMGCVGRDSVTVIIDETPPFLECPENIDTNIVFGKSTLLLSPPLPTVSDECTYTLINDFTNVTNATGNYPFGITTLTWLAVDENGNVGTCSMDVNIGLDEKVSDFTACFRISPNPNFGQFTVESLVAEEVDVQFRVVNVLGQVIYENTDLLQDKVLVDISSHPSGMYFLLCSIAGDEGVQKVVIAR